MHHVLRSRRRLRASHAGFITAMPLIIAALSAAVLMSACHSTPSIGAQAPVASTTDVAATCDAACVARTMPHLAAFDEQFYTPPADTDASQD